MQKIILPLLLAFIIAGCTSKTASESKPEGFNVSDADNKDLEAAEKKMFDEIIKFGDYWKTDIDDDYVTINADGAMQTKAECIADTAHRKIFAGVSSTRLSDRKVRKYGDIAIINGKAQFMAGDKMAVEVFYTEIWLKKDGKWMFNGWQGTMTKEMQQAMMKPQ
jgi:hypothetical protein